MRTLTHPENRPCGYAVDNESRLTCKGTRQIGTHEKPRLMATTGRGFAGGVCAELERDGTHQKYRRFLMGIWRLSGSGYRALASVPRYMPHRGRSEEFPSQCVHCGT
jgi:hypothetical protein